jgi:hypothetical protein
MTPEEAVTALDDFDANTDPVKAHSYADRILLATVPSEVRQAYHALGIRSDYWRPSGHPDYPHRHTDGLNWIYDGQAGYCVRFIPSLGGPQ